jgi:uncharacterized protein YjiK
MDQEITLPEVMTTKRLQKIEKIAYVENNLFMYILARDNAVSQILVQEQQKEQKISISLCITSPFRTKKYYQEIEKIAYVAI